MTSTCERSVLVVEDDETLQAALQYNLGKEGYRVLAATDGEAAVALARKEHPSIVVLDLMLPKLNGLEVCRLIRREMTMPILILTALDQEMDKVVGLELGADDYMTKPFSIPEFLARVRAMVRRSEMVSGAENLPEILATGNLSFDLQARVVRLNGLEMELKPKEYDLLTFLATHPGRAYTRDQLLDHVWGYDYVGDTRTVDVHIRWLREKIEVDPGSPRLIITIRGTGYRFEI